MGAATLAFVVRRSARDRARAAAFVGGLALGSASGCNDIVALDCDAPAVTAACATGSSEGSSGVGDATTATSGTSSGATVAGSDLETSVTDATGVADTGSFCGDGIVDGDEECDDGDPIDIDECSNECRRPVCGNGIVQIGEDCDLGGANDDHGTCKSDCRAAICGDGVVLSGVESCDGGDLDGYSCEIFGYPGGDLGCDAACQLDLSTCSLCPDGTEQCDAYQPCDEACESGLPCWNETGIGTCLPTCMGPENCRPYAGFPAECIGDMCVVPCEKECPDGLTCQMTQLHPSPVCLW